MTTNSTFGDLLAAECSDGLDRGDLLVSALADGWTLTARAIRAGGDLPAVRAAYYDERTQGPPPCEDHSAVMAFVATGDFGALRRAVSGPAARYQDWYYYSHSGSSSATREPSPAARAVITVATRYGWKGASPQGTSWCNRWRRTQASLRTEDEGFGLIRDALDHLRRRQGVR